jgi:hypothetical protein
MGTERYAEQSIQARFTKKLNMRKEKEKRERKEEKREGCPYIHRAGTRALRVVP